MLFHRFSSQIERREFGGSDFIELQYCCLPYGTDIAEIVSVDAVEICKNDSLYIYGDDMDVFYRNYVEIFTGGIYNNLKRGPVDLLGINFYSQEQASCIIQLLKIREPLDHQALFTWLEQGKQYIGFYVLGI